MKMLFENLNIFIPSALAGGCDIPKIEPTKKIDGCEWIGFNCAKTYKGKKEGAGVHFFLDDAQFIRLWNSPDKYIELLRPFKYICAPDFSLYSNMPKALQIYNHYRKHWIAAYWQELGFSVIPTISWSDESSFEWCFDGEPQNSIIAIGTAGTQQNKKTRAAFERGYNAMLKRLNPTKILVFGKLPDNLSGNICHIGDLAKERFMKGGN